MPYQKWQQVEAEFGKPMREVLDQLYCELGSSRLVAQRLGITMKGLRDWRRDTGCKAVLRIECDATARESATNGKAGT